jgi:transposase
MREAKGQAGLWEGLEAPAEARAEKAEGEKAKGKPRFQTIDRTQIRMRVVNVDRLVEDDHDVRAIWEFVKGADLSWYEEKVKAVEHEAGRPAVSPQVLVSLWVYAYSRGISSAHEVARRCQWEPAFQWLTGMEPVNYHTLSDFRVKHKEALDQLFTDILGRLSAEGLVSVKRVMHDGVKIQANAGADTFRREKTLQEHLEAARQQVEAMADPREETHARVAAARERAARERHQRLQRALEERSKAQAAKAKEEDKAETRVSETDPTCRMMKQGDGGYKPSYNAQITADGTPGRIITSAHLSQAASDYGEFIPALDQTHQRTGRMPEQGVTDGGFISRANILAAQERGVQMIGPVDDGAAQGVGQLKRQGIDPAFYPEAFRYEAESDQYVCPTGKVLRYKGKERREGITLYFYRAEAEACAGCPEKPKCCPKKEGQGRRVTRRQEDEAIQQWRAKMETDEAKAIYQQRGAISEFVNLWLKEKIGLRRFRVRGLVKATMELLWACLTHNIQQWIRLRWRAKRTGTRTAEGACALRAA